MIRRRDTPDGLPFRVYERKGASKRRAPWADFAGNDIHEGDTIQHPSGERGVVCFFPGEEEPSDQWRVCYVGEVLPSRLILQVGDKGRAIVRAAAAIGENV